MSAADLGERLLEEVGRWSLAAALPGWSCVAFEGPFDVQFHLVDDQGKVVLALAVDDGWLDDFDDEPTEDTKLLSPCCQAQGSGFVANFCEACGQSYSFQEWPVTSGPISIQEDVLVGSLVARKVFDPLAAVMMTRVWLNVVLDDLDQINAPITGGYE